MRRGVIVGALVMLAIGCASTPPPPPPQQQAEVPIRTQDEIARDQSSGATIVDPAQCKTQPSSPGCPKKTNPDAFADTRTGHRLPRMVQH